MTLLGKLLVVLNTILSVLMLGWALLVYLHREDWSSQSATPGQQSGEVGRRNDRVKQLWTVLDPAEKDRGSEQAELVKLEEAWVSNQPWYATEMENVRKSAQPLQTPVYKDGKVAVEEGNIGRPQMEAAKDWAGRPLKSAQVSLDELNATLQQIDDAVKALGAAIDQEREQTELLVGKGKGDKGFRQRLADEEAELAQLAVVAKELQSKYTNTQVEAELLLSRRTQLKARIEELKRLVAREP